MVDKVLFSSQSEEWHTPKTLYYYLNAMFHFDLDPCTTKDNPLGTRKFYTKKENGLKQQWDAKNVFVNPPYNRAINNWLHKAQTEVSEGRVKNAVVMLLPARTDTKWFHEYIYNVEKHRFRDHVEVWFLKGRLKFGGAKNSAPFPSMVVIFRNKKYRAEKWQ